MAHYENDGTLPPAEMGHLQECVDREEARARRAVTEKKYRTIEELELGAPKVADVDYHPALDGVDGTKTILVSVRRLGQTYGLEDAHAWIVGDRMYLIGKKPE